MLCATLPSVASLDINIAMGTRVYDLWERFILTSVTQTLLENKVLKSSEKKVLTSPQARNELYVFSLLLTFMY